MIKSILIKVINILLENKLKKNCKKLIKNINNWLIRL